MPRVRALTIERRERERTENLNSILVAEIYSFCKINGMSLEDVAEKIGISTSSMYNRVRRPESFRLNELRALQRLMRSGTMKMEIPAEVFG